MTNNRKTANEILGLTETYQHDIDEKSLKCKKCHEHVKGLTLKVCPVIGRDEFSSYRNDNGEDISRGENR